MKKYLFGFLFQLILVSNVRSQNGDIRAFYEVNVNSKDYRERAEVYSGNQNINPKENRLYFWYSSNKILSTVGGFDGKLLHGQYCSFYLNDNLKEKGVFKKGLKDSKWTQWYPDGNIKSVVTWRNGVRYGETVYFDEKGIVLHRSNFKDDRLNGTCVEYKDGKVLLEKKYKNGVEVIKISRPVKKSKEKVNSSDKTSSKSEVVKGKFYKRFSNLMARKMKQHSEAKTKGRSSKITDSEKSKSDK